MDTHTYLFHLLLFCLALISLFLSLISYQWGESDSNSHINNNNTITIFVSPRHSHLYNHNTYINSQNTHTITSISQTLFYINFLPLFCTDEGWRRCIIKNFSFFNFLTVIHTNTQQLTITKLTHFNNILVRLVETSSSSTVVRRWWWRWCYDDDYLRGNYRIRIIFWHSHAE